MKRLVLSIVILCLLFVGFVFLRQDKGQIIGNPDFESSFLHVTGESFKEDFEAASERLVTGLTLRSLTESTYSTHPLTLIYSIDDVIELQYDEGFIKVFVADTIDAETLWDFLCTITLTLQPDLTGAEMDEILKNVAMAESVEDMLSEDMMIFSREIDYRFYREEYYEIHIEDLRMGH